MPCRGRYDLSVMLADQGVSGFLQDEQWMVLGLVHEVSSSSS